MTKRDEDNPEYTGKVLCSPGLGAGYIKRMGKRHEWKGEKTKEDYYTRQGTLIALPKSKLSKPKSPSIAIIMSAAS